MRYASVCSGVEAASLAWMPLGWEAVFFAEIEPFPCAVLKERFPDVPNLGDMTEIKGEKYHGTVDLLVGGTPCQGFSVAGKQGGLNDSRSASASPIADFLRLCVPGGSCGKTSPVFSAQIKGMISGRSLGKLMKSGILSRGECWTLNTCEWTDTLAPFLNVDGVCSLSDILETGDIPPRYYLSPTACIGILRRAASRGKDLPEILKKTLECQAGCGTQAESIPHSISRQRALEQ